ncbi:MAG: 4Fe-4S binding protein [Firmicutes bacterium]|nr:4Fe-4S binding protein [Bacillota bacterium]
MHKIKEGCPGCGACAPVCPVHTIEAGPGVAVRIGDRCIDCGLCVFACPIQLIFPDRGRHSRGAARKIKQEKNAL